MSNTSKPFIAIDGRRALRWPQDFRGAYAYHLLAELGFMSRPYDIKVFGDVLADSALLKKMRLLHPVDLLITPNDFLWAQMAFPQASHGADLLHFFDPWVPIMTRMPQVMTVFQEDLSVRLLPWATRRASAVMTLTRDVKEQLSDKYRTTTAVVADPHSTIKLSGSPPTRQEFFLWEPDERTLKIGVNAFSAWLRQSSGRIKVIVRNVRGDTWVRRLAHHFALDERLEPVRPATPELWEALYREARAILVVGDGDAAFTSALNGLSAHTPVLALDAPRLQRLLPEDAAFWLSSHDPEHAHQTIQALTSASTGQAGQARPAPPSWKETAQVAHSVYLKVLQSTRRL